MVMTYLRDQYEVSIKKKGTLIIAPIHGVIDNK